MRVTEILLLVLGSAWLVSPSMRLLQAAIQHSSGPSRTGAPREQADQRRKGDVAGRRRLGLTAGSPRP